jgi:hypothetical protein
MDNAATPLSHYAPGNLAKLTPEERAKALKRSKGKDVKLSPAMLTTPPTPMVG